MSHSRFPLPTIAKEVKYGSRLCWCNEAPVVWNQAWHLTPVTPIPSSPGSDLPFPHFIWSLSHLFYPLPVLDLAGPVSVPLSQWHTVEGFSFPISAPDLCAVAKRCYTLWHFCNCVHLWNTCYIAIHSNLWHWYSGINCQHLAYEYVIISLSPWFWKIKFYHKKGLLENTSPLVSNLQQNVWTSVMEKYCVWGNMWLMWRFCYLKCWVCSGSFTHANQLSPPNAATVTWQPVWKTKILSCVVLCPDPSEFFSDEYMWTTIITS